MELLLHGVMLLAAAPATSAALEAPQPQQGQQTALPPPPATAPTTAGTSAAVDALPGCGLENWTWAVFCKEHDTCGNATGHITPAAGSGCAAAEMASTGSTPASAAFASPLFAIEPTAVYSVAWTVGLCLLPRAPGTS